MIIPRSRKSGSLALPVLRIHSLPPDRYCRDINPS